MISLFYPSEKTQWKKLENIIIKLQQRITKAALQGNYRKLRNLERLFLKSHSGRFFIPWIYVEADEDPGSGSDFALHRMRIHITA